MARTDEHELTLREKIAAIKRNGFPISQVAFHVPVRTCLGTMEVQLSETSSKQNTKAEMWFCNIRGFLIIQKTDKNEFVALLPPEAVAWDVVKMDE